MGKKIYSKYIRFIGDIEFLKEFVPNIKNESDSEQVESYMFHSTPKYIKIKMRDYQIEGLNWLIKMYENKINCILADEMGLGKTLQSISILGYIKHIKQEKSKSLVVVPKSVLQNWANEFEKFLPTLKVKTFWCSKSELHEESKNILYKNYDVVLTTYEMCLYSKNILRKIKFKYLIMDEAHRLKNENSMLTKTLRKCKFQNRLLLTGTPLQNNIHELWALLNFILPDIFYDAEKFEDFVVDADQKQNKNKIEKLRNVLQLFFLRREKADVEHTLLPKKITNIYAPLSELQRNWYKGILKKDLSSLYSENCTSRTAMLNIIMQLRKVCNHPYLFDGVEEEPFVTGEHIVENSGKLIILDKLLLSLQKSGSRVLLFSQMARVLDILEDYVVLRGFNYCRIDGSTNGEDRTSSIDNFNREDSDKFIFLLTTRAGGLGINLYTADTVIIFDSDWNPYADLQAQDRAHRIGQKRQVQVFRLITENTIEENIILRAQQKLKLDDILMRKNEKIKQNTISNTELMSILAAGIENIEKQEKIAKLSVDDILRIGEEKTQEMNKKLNEFKISKNNTSGKIDMYNWEGENYYKKKIETYVEKNLPEESSKRNSFFKCIVFKPLIFPDYQFYPKEFYDLQNKEEELFNKNQTLTEEDKEIKEKLLSQGYDWTKKDYKNFISSLETFGPNLEKIKKNFPNKTDVKEYFDVFFKRYNELADSDKIESMLKKTREKFKRKEKIKQIFNKNPENTIENALLVKNKFFNNNLHLLKLYLKYSDGEKCFENIKLDLMKDPNFTFDYFHISRTPHELSKHINLLTTQLLKEFDKNE